MNASAGRSVQFSLLFGHTPPQPILCRTGAPVRLHHLGAILPPTTSLISGPNQEDVLIAALKRRCTPWDRMLLSLIDRYFAFLHRRLEENRQEIERQLAPFEGLFRPEDTLFSAPALLPHARVNQDGWDDVPFGAAIWSGRQLIALFDGSAGETPRRLRERAERLNSAGIANVTFPRETTAASDDAFFDGLLGPSLKHFFSTELLPSAPLPPDLAPDFLVQRLYSATT